MLLFLRLHPSTEFQTLVDYEGYSISSKGFLPTVVDTVAILLSKIFGIVAQLVHFLLFSLYLYKLVAPLIFLSYIFFSPHHQDY